MCLMRWQWVTLAILVCAMVGCGSGENLVTVTGKVVDGGAAVVIENYEEGGSCIELELIPLDDAGEPKGDAETHYAIVAEDSTFVVDGNDGSGIPAGKYKVAAYRRGETEDENNDVWGGKFGPDNTPFAIEANGTDEAVIDISKSPAG
ncbi:MAG TPA: hypothetical protein QF564_02480 [Pirellulaceae bacterium]|nr:hypothetical protein [Pirellulaceae bacterium]